ncbi:MAG: translation elongation factor 4 [Candidatus Omnitrophica bacterium]|nr:translation elongation factor 4 [Candidatus Omnitrophota bacterium]
MANDLIRNFCIIAHIDHGKSTLADRFLEYTGAITERDFREQLLDNMDLERERGITIKASAVCLNYKADDGQEYILNLIDTPGHVDFTYEVSKSLGACEGVLLLVDAAQGVEAQTVANMYLALEQNLYIIPVINKIDLANAQPARAQKQLESIMGTDHEDMIMASAKTGIGTKEILETIVRQVPPPGGDVNNPLQALVFDSNFDTYRGIVVYVRVFNGEIRPGLQVKMMATGHSYEVQETGVFRPKPEKTKKLSSGQVGFIICNIKDAADITIGDTVTESSCPAKEALPGYKKMQPMVFCGIYPVNAGDFSRLREAIDKLKLNDSSFVAEQESSASFNFGFRCGFLGLLHMEIAQERLEREYDLNLIVTTPSVVYRVTTTKNKVIEVDNPIKLPEPTNIKSIEEPYIKCFIITPAQALGNVMQLTQERRGIYISTEYLDEERVQLTYTMPLAEAIIDFYDKIKSITRGYGSMDYEIIGYEPTQLVKLDILINNEVCDALSFLVHRDKAENKGRSMVEKLKELIPRQLFQVAIQAAIGGKVIARETVRAMGKNVTSKCYGGDITRKRKLREKQKAGKKRMKQFGKVEIPQEAFMAAIKTN